jgi:peroxiredoxin
MSLSIPAQNHKVFPVEEISPEFKSSSHLKIVTFIPSISDQTEYASMIVQAFKNYFVEKLAFAPEDRNKVNIDIIFCTEKLIDSIDNQNNTKIEEMDMLLFLDDLDDKTALNNISNSLLNTQGMQVFYPISTELKSQLQLPFLENLNADSVLFLLDENNVIVLKDEHYRGQGEHLKPLEHKIKELLGLPYPEITPNQVSLKVGDKAPDILLELPYTQKITPKVSLIPGDKAQKISQYLGNVLVLTFYPAAYSGIFDISKMIKRIHVDQTTKMSCAMHIVSFDGLSSKVETTNTRTVYFAISESTPEILQKWQESLKTYHVRYLNDPDYSISQAFGAYNPKGYNNRITVIIDKNGNIAYIDKEYNLNKESEIQSIVEELQTTL